MERRMFLRLSVAGISLLSLSVFLGQRIYLPAEPVNNQEHLTPQTELTPRSLPLVVGYAPDRNSINLTGNKLNQMMYAPSRIINFFTHLDGQNDDWELPEVERVAKDGKIPMISLGPTSSMEEFMTADNEVIIRNNVRKLKALEKPVLIRFAYEMNGDWFPFGRNFGDQSFREYLRSSNEFKKGWRFFAQIVRGENADNIQLVWSPDVKHEFELYYPGDDWVDIVGLDGYNKHTSDFFDLKHWYFPNQSFDDLFGKPLERMRQLTDKPMMIAEIGTADEKNARAWTADAMRKIRANPNIWAVVFFAWDKKNQNPATEANWGKILSEIKVDELVTESNK